MKRIFSLISIIVGILTIIFLVRHLINGGSGVSFVTFLLWTVIVAITTIATVREKGNYILPLILAIGNLSVALALLWVGEIKWSTVEWVTLLLVLICIYVWLTSTSSRAIITSTVAITIAGIPQLITAWNNPYSISVPIWIGFLISSFFSILAGKDWSIKERLYATARTLFYAAVIIVAICRF